MMKEGKLYDITVIIDFEFELILGL
jgi:hypothetical protein